MSPTVGYQNPTKLLKRLRNNKSTHQASAIDVLVISPDHKIAHNGLNEM